MDQRVAFIAEWLRDEWTMTELAERYQISRKTAYKWVDRYDADPAAGLADRSRAPKAHGRAMADAASRRDPGAAARASALGAEEAARDLAERQPRRRVAGGEHDGRPVAPRGRQSAASSHALRRAVDAAVGGGAGAE